MYSDPQSLTINGSAVTLPRTASGVDNGGFTAADGNVKMTVSHQYGKRARRTVRIDHKKIVPDELLTSVSKQVSTSVYVVVDAPLVGYNGAEQKQIIDALAAWLAAGTGAANNALRLVGGES